MVREINDKGNNKRNKVLKEKMNVEQYNLFVKYNWHNVL